MDRYYLPLCKIITRKIRMKRWNSLINSFLFFCNRDLLDWKFQLRFNAIIYFQSKSNNFVLVRICHARIKLLSFVFFFYRSFSTKILHGNHSANIIPCRIVKAIFLYIHIHIYFLIIYIAIWFQEKYFV